MNIDEKAEIPDIAIATWPETTLISRKTMTARTSVDAAPRPREVADVSARRGLPDRTAPAAPPPLELRLKDANRLAFTPDGRRVLVSDGQGSNLLVLDAAARTEITRFDLAPNAVLVEPDGSRAYAALRGDNSVAVIDLDTLKVIGQIPTGPNSGPGCMFWLPRPSERPWRLARREDASISRKIKISF